MIILVKQHLQNLHLLGKFTNLTSLVLYGRLNIISSLGKKTMTNNVLKLSKEKSDILNLQTNVLQCTLF